MLFLFSYRYFSGGGGGGIIGAAYAGYVENCLLSELNANNLDINRDLILDSNWDVYRYRYMPFEEVMNQILL